MPNECNPIHNPLTKAELLPPQAKGGVAIVRATFANKTTMDCLYTTDLVKAQQFLHRICTRHNLPTPLALVP